MNHTVHPENRRRPGPRRHLAALIATLLVAAITAACQPSWAESRIDLRVLVFDDGSTNVAAIRDRMFRTGVPHDVIDLTASGRTEITEDRLRDPASADGHAYYQGIVFPNHRPAALSSAETEVIEDFQRDFSIRRVAAYAWPGPESGPHWDPTGITYSGPLDQMVADFGLLGPFVLPSLVGTLPFDLGSWGALGTSSTDDFAELLPIVEMPRPGGGPDAPIMSLQSIDGIEEMQLTVTLNPYQQQGRTLLPYVIEFLTKGVHLGYDRNYLSVHVDDVFLPDDRWSIEGNCTPGEDCLPGPGGEPPVETDPIRMTAADVDATVAWQDANDFTFEMAYNGFGADEARSQGPDPLTDRLLALEDEFEWINHTYRHDYLGCLKDLTVRPWRCETDGAGNLLWYSQADLTHEIQANIDWAVANGVTIDPAEIVTGEHSGLVTLPQQPTDSPYLPAVLDQTGIRWLASDNSRESHQRTIAGATTVPRHPMNIFYNVATRAELIDEYNWIYNSSADGGSGICEVDPNSTCIDPLGPDGFETYIMPTERAIAMGHITGNDPRPHYVHQSNLAEERLLLLAMDDILGHYRSIYTDRASLVIPSQTEAGVLLRDMTRWQGAGMGPDARVVAYRVGNEVFVEVDGDPVMVPLTVPVAAPWGEAWGPGRSGWTSVAPTEPLVVPIR